MKVAFLSDLHFGVRNGSTEWLEIQLSYIRNFFIPTIRLHKVERLIISGDVFDNRQSINIYIYNKVLDLFIELTKEFKDIHIIVGNHDINNKTTNNINSVNLLRLINNVHVYTEPNIVDDFVFMPWANHQEHILLQGIKPEKYLVMHTDIKSLHFNKFAKINDGVDINTLSDYKYVFNGHIHYTQELGNIVMLGSPYHLSRNDLDNKKYIYILDTSNDKLLKIENTYSPKFIQMDLFDLFEYSLADAKNIFNNNFIYLTIDNTIQYNSILNNIIGELNNSRNIKLVYYENAKTTVEISLNNTWSIDNIIKEYINSLDISDADKQNVSNIINSYKQKI